MRVDGDPGQAGLVHQPTLFEMRGEQIHIRARLHARSDAGINILEVDALANCGTARRYCDAFLIFKSSRIDVLYDVVLCSFIGLEKLNSSFW